MSVLELRSGTYVAVMWNGVVSPRRPSPGKLQRTEIFGALFRHAHDPPCRWRLNYRFRYVVDDKTIDSEDKKSFYSSHVTGIEDDVVAKTLAAMQIVCDGDLKVCEIGSADMDAIVATIRELPWMNYYPVGSA